MWLCLFLLLGCPDAPQDTASTAVSTTETEASEVDTRQYRPITVTVTLDGEPAPDVVLMQGGRTETWTTDAEGVATVRVDTDESLGEIAIHASHPEARIQADYIRSGDTTLLLELTRFSLEDNLAYVFQDPGTLELRTDSTYCSHCHLNIVEDWQDSVHRDSANNPVVQDVYAGVASALEDASACAAAGGSWWEGLEPGTAASTERCYLGWGTLPDLNEDCGDAESCDGEAEATGQCADCHAPAIDGELGGRDLLEATELAYDYGVHCDLCHKVESVDLEDPAPGVAGRLHVLRPSEESPSLALGDWAPLQFGPYADVANPRMGAVAREHYGSGEICAGCHEHHQEVLVPDASIDETRWPDGRLPVHTTYSEWQSSAFGDEVPCLACHMPPDPEAGNGATIEAVLTDDSEQGIPAGWWRQPGEVRHHTWYGPRHPEERLLELAAAVDLDTSVDATTLTVEATVSNVGPAHAIPTGEPLRALLLLVEATCDGEALAPTGGHVLPDWAGAEEHRTAAEDWSLWPEASAGDVLRVVAGTGEWLDYEGYGPFGDGTFSAEDKGLPEEVFVGEVTVTAVDTDGTVTLSADLPEGDDVYRLAAASLPEDGAAAAAWAGHPGMAFARVLADAEGATMVPHHRAVDVLSDNRLLPQQQWTSTHTFAATCEEPTVEAVLVHRALPLALARERGWTLTESVMTRSTR